MKTISGKITCWQLFGCEVQDGELPLGLETALTTDDGGAPMLLLVDDGEPVGEAWCEEQYVEHAEFGCVPLRLDGTVDPDFRAEALNRGIVVPERLS